VARHMVPGLWQGIHFARTLESESMCCVTPELHVGELGLGYYSDEGFSVYVQPFIRRFAPSSVFRGAVQGFVFKMDDCGIGYYTDLNNLVYVQLAPSGG